VIVTITGRALFHELAGGGSSTPIVFMHGGMGLDHTYFRPWVDALGNDRRLIFYDQYGNGRSRTVGASNTSMTLDALAQMRTLCGRICSLKALSYWDTPSADALHSRMPSRIRSE
jgi:pimeloyl-ACP methyl ester carboxylesterase